MICSKILIILGMIYQSSYKIKSKKDRSVKVPQVLFENSLNYLKRKDIFLEQNIVHKHTYTRASQN